MNRQYFEPTSVREAVEILDKNPDAAILAGGTDLVVADRSGKRALPETIVTIHRLDALRGISETADGGLRIGSLTTHRDLESASGLQTKWRALSDAAALVGSPATRHAGTVGGNICNASPAMEIGSPLLIFDATVELESISGTRTMPFGQFVTGPGKTARKGNELLTAVTVPPLPGRDATSAYVRLEYRQAMEIAVVGAAAMVLIDASDRYADARIALTAAAPTCVRAAKAERTLKGQSMSDELQQQAAEAAAEAAKPIDDVRGSAAYRRAMVAVITRQVIDLALSRRSRTGARASVTA